jgi:hypothetical protein
MKNMTCAFRPSDLYIAIHYYLYSSFFVLAPPIYTYTIMMFYAVVITLLL